jgi:hypothetical protein
VINATASSARAVVARYFRIWNDGEPSAVGDLIGADWVDHAHPERRTAADIQSAIELARVQRPDARVLVDAILGDDNLVMVNGRIVDNGRTESRVWLVRVQDDRLQEIWTYAAD